MNTKNTDKIVKNLNKLKALLWDCPFKEVEDSIIFGIHQDNSNLSIRGVAKMSQKYNILHINVVNNKVNIYNEDILWKSLNPEVVRDKLKYFSSTQFLESLNLSFVDIEDKE